mmetsp:Transcript_51189/g.158586  ORF Transcript_51189/g.158586 Transcript_51189/m.158586 type:complete len:270 (+) Transcript_51189:483-1292(+)
MKRSACCRSSRARSSASRRSSIICFSFSSRSLARAASWPSLLNASSASCSLRSLASASRRLRSASSLLPFSSFRFRLRSSRSFSRSSCSSKASSAASCSLCSRSRCRQASSSASRCSSASFFRASKASCTFLCSASIISFRHFSSRRRSCSFRFRSSMRFCSRSCSAIRSSTVIWVSICHHSGVFDRDLRFFFSGSFAAPAAAPGAGVAVPSMTVPRSGCSGQLLLFSNEKGTLFQTLASDSKVAMTVRCCSSIFDTYTAKCFFCDSDQ